jgi:AraC family transcriptional regulator
MRGAARRKPGGDAGPAERTIVERIFAAGDGWSVRDYVCRAGPADRPFEEAHDGFSVSAVVAGSFSYRSGAGAALLYPGAILLGNNGRCFECDHPHGVGDRCLSINVREDLFSEIAATAASTSRFHFSTPSLPPAPGVLPVAALMESFAAVPASRREEMALSVVERVMSAMSGRGKPSAPPTAREARRVGEAIRFIESNAAGSLQLKDLAAAAGVSKYHFLRVFRRLTGLTPYQYLLSVRMRRAARGLVSSRRPVLEVALDSGFGDLSTFNKRFRETFGATPTQFRASAV